MLFGGFECLGERLGLRGLGGGGEGGTVIVDEIDLLDRRGSTFQTIEVQ